MSGRRPETRIGGSRSVPTEGEPRVKIRAAVLEEFGQPLAVQEVDLAEPTRG